MTSTTTTRPEAEIAEAIIDRLATLAIDIAETVADDIRDTIRREVEDAITEGIADLDVETIIGEAATMTTAAGDGAGIDHEAEHTGFTDEVTRRLHDALAGIVTHAIETGIDEAQADDIDADTYLDQGYGADSIAADAIDDVLLAS